MARFSDDELRRYGRQMVLREVGGRGQERLRAARLWLRAAGAVGRVAAEYLARAGVGAVQAEAASGGRALVGPAGGAPVLWAACDGARGEVGWGCACGAVLADEAEGEAAFLVGSLLALETLKGLLALPEALAAPPRRLLAVDLDGDPVIAPRSAPPCGCASPPALA